MTSPTPAQTVDEIRAGLEGVTPGEWEVKTQDEWEAGFDFFSGSDGAFTFPVDLEPQDAAHIARCSPARLLPVLDEFDRMRERIAALEAERDELAEARNHQVFLRMAAEADLAEAREWSPIATCPLQEAVDLWCVYGGEEYAQYEGGASIGKLVPSRFKTKDYGFFGNQSNDGIPQANAPDLVPVAWRKAVPQCPATLIAEALGIPVTLEEARAFLTKEK